MKKNVGTIDKVIRILVAVVVVVLFLTHVISGVLAIVLLALSAVFVVTSLLSFCPIWMALGLSTRKKEQLVMENSCEAKPSPKNIKDFFRSWQFWKPFLGVLIGGIAGFLYYHFVGCSSGTCSITSHSYSSIIFGGLLGYLISSGN